MNIETMIYSFAEENNLTTGICSAEDFDFLRPVLERRNHLLKGFAEQNIEKRISPKLTFSNVKSIIVLAMNYNKKISFLHDNELRGHFSIGAVGTDYHILLKEKLLQLASLLQNHAVSFQAFVDTGALVDREIALRACIGYRGKNCSIHIPEKGSMVFIGYLLIDKLLSPSSKTFLESCGDCKKCIASCPSGALSENEPFAIQKCISYITQKKGLLSHWEMKTIGLQLYGCDICQITCPHNQNNRLSDFVSSEEITPLLSSILSLSNKQFQETIGKTAAGWVGKKIIQRNAVAVLGNIRKKESLFVLQKCLFDIRPLIRHTAVKAIYNLNLKEGITILKEALKKETETEIQEEIKQTIFFLEQ